METVHFMVSKKMEIAIHTTSQYKVCPNKHLQNVVQATSTIFPVVAVKLIGHKTYTFSSAPTSPRIFNTGLIQGD